MIGPLCRENPSRERAGGWQSPERRHIEPRDLAPVFPRESTHPVSSSISPASSDNSAAVSSWSSTAKCISAETDSSMQTSSKSQPARVCLLLSSRRSRAWEIQGGGPRSKKRTRGMLKASHPSLRRTRIIITYKCIHVVIIHVAWLGRTNHRSVHRHALRSLHSAPASRAKRICRRAMNTSTYWRFPASLVVPIRNMRLDQYHRHAESHRIFTVIVKIPLELLLEKLADTQRRNRNPVFRTLPVHFRALVSLMKPNVADGPNRIMDNVLLAQQLSCQAHSQTLVQRTESQEFTRSVHVNNERYRRYSANTKAASCKFQQLEHSAQGCFCRRASRNARYVKPLNCLPCGAEVVSMPRTCLVGDTILL